MEGIEDKAAAFQKETHRILEGVEDGQRIRSVDEEWNEIRNAVMESAEKSIGYQKSTRAKKPCVTEAMIVKMDERRKYKNLNTEEDRESYKRMNNELRRATDKAK